MDESSYGTLMACSLVNGVAGVCTVVGVFGTCVGVEPIDGNGGRLAGTGCSCHDFGMAA